MDIASYLKEQNLTQQQFAAKIGVTQGRVSHWVKGATVPAERCAAIEQATGGRVTRHELRPDVFGAVQRAADQPTEARAA